jgi:hypothetical protein
MQIIRASELQDIVEFHARRRSVATMAACRIEERR